MKKLYILSVALFVFSLGLSAQSTPDNWTVATSLITVSEETTTVSEGAKAMKVVFTGTANEDIRSESFSVTGGASFVYTLDVYDNDAAGRVRMAIIWSSANDYSTIYSADLATFQTLTYSGTVPAEATSAYVLLRFYDISGNWDGDAELIIDNASFTENAGINLIQNPSFELWSVLVIPEYTIAEIQGNTGASPYDGDMVITSGIVTGVFATGYFIQDGAGAWNGIFVYDNAHDPLLGDSLTIKAIVDEYNGKTELTSVSEYNVNSVDNTLPDAVVVTTLAAAGELYEGVLVKVENAACTNEDAGFGEWTVDDGSGAINIDDFIFAYTPTLGTTYSITGIVDYANSAYKILPRSLDDIVELGNPIEIAIADAQNNSSLTVEPNPITVLHGEDVSFDVTIQYATFSPDLPTGYYVDAYISFTDPLMAGLNINIVHTGYGIDVNYAPEAGTSVLTLSQMLGTSPALLSGHSGITDVWTITITGLGVGQYQAEIASLCDDNTDGPYSTFILASDVLDVFVTSNIVDALYEVFEASSLTITPESQVITQGNDAVLTAVAVYPETIDPILSEYLTDALITFEDVTPSGATVDIVYDDNMGGHADLGSFELPSGIYEIYLSELIESARTPLSGHAGLTITWSITIHNLPQAYYIFHMNTVTNTEAGFGTEDYLLADDWAIITVQEAQDELIIESQSPDMIVCEGTEVVLTVVVTGAENITYAWYNGETLLGFTENSITVSEEGQYVCIATAEELQAISDTMDVTISIPMPELGENASYCTGYEVILNPGIFMGYDWGSSVEPTLTVTENGEYFVTVSDEYGCTAVDSVEVAFAEELTLNLGEDIYICPDGSVEISSPIPGTYAWSNETVENSILVTEAGTYSLTVTQASCTATDEIEVIQASNPEEFDLGEEINLCIGAEAELTSPVEADSYLWNTGEETNSITVTETGLYTLTIYNEHGCSVSDDIQVNFNNFIIVNLGDDIESCHGQTVVLDPLMGISWLWSDSSDADTLAVTESGDYSVTVTDQYGCSGSDEINVYFRDLPVIELANDTTICDGFSITINAVDNMTYLWNTGETTQEIIADNMGNYIVTITDEFGCSNSDSLFLTVLPVPVVDLGPDNTISEDQTVILGNYPGYASYLWSNEAVTDYIVINGAQLGVGEHLFWVLVTSANGCETYDEVLITVVEGIGVDPEMIAQLAVYPNPASAMLNIDFGSVTGEKAVSLFDATGKTVLSEVTGSGLLKMDISSLQQGLYIIRITTNGITITRTVVVQ
ncbi:MAG TPA: T9SS type A sorting domain-containing protein [Bacteroidales bacterium]|nr:T9SS type A sorting domain-containing protein [Bacteroidales bacterium]HQP04106.1 T9SS type A sorting domain-containing protein [Bacteroidales bacterium]